MIDFNCEGCGMPVTWFGRATTPPHGLCAVCEWISAHLPPEQIMETRRRIEPGGWVSEREQRKAARSDG